jgi:serine/threonine protein kinase
MLKADPKERLTAAQALQHEWFKPRDESTDTVIKLDTNDFKVRDESANDKGHNPLATVTPIMAGRTL